MKSIALIGMAALFILSGCSGIPHKHVRKTDTSKIIGEYEQQKEDARYCYSDYLKNNPGLEAKIVLKWTVDRSGKALESMVTKDTLEQPSISKCLLSHLNSLKFSPTPIFHKATIEYTYNLKSESIIIE